MVLGTCLRKAVTGSFSPAANRRLYTKMLERMVEVYREAAAAATEVKNAWIVATRKGSEGTDQEVFVEVTWSSRNLATKERTQTTSNYIVRREKDRDSVVCFPPTPLHKKVTLRRTSPSGQLTACVVGGEGEGEGKEKAEGEHITLTSQDGSSLRTFDLSAMDKHGKVYADPEFSCLEFSRDESKLAYVAEKKRPKASSFLAPPASSDEDTRGTEFIHRDEWGEQLMGKSESVVCVLDLPTGSLSVHTLRDGLCPAQLTFLSGDGGKGGKGWALVGVGFASQPYRLGLVYCQNRESQLFYLDSDGKFELLGSKGHNIQTPRWNSNGSQLAFLRATAGGPHAKVAQLCLLSWPSRQERVLVDVVGRMRECPGGGVFRGINGRNGLPRRCWSDDGATIIFSALNLDTLTTYIVNVESGVVSGMGESEGRSQRVWDGCGDLLLVEETSLCCPGRLVLKPRTATGLRGDTQTGEVMVKGDIGGLPENYLTQWTFTNPFPHPKPEYSDIPISVLYVGPPSNPQGLPKCPLVVVPHGGPHSCSANVFSYHVSFFVRLGFCVLLPNYRGSLGAGMDGILSLPGHCGLTDVSDVHQATLACLSRFADVVDNEQVFLFGGSHGGFLVTHLAAQHPDTYKAVSALNPVVDISAMFSLSDIPDWCFIETGHDFEHGLIPDGPTMAKMQLASPISHLDSLTAPVLLLVGAQDLRVPPSQALRLYKMLLARGKKTELYMYPDCHSLSKVGVEVDCFIHAALWFHKHGAVLPASPV